MKNLYHKKITAFLGSNWFLLVVLLLFVCEAGWLAVTSRYPMAFDEAYHFGLIQFFSHHWSPIINSQPATTYGLGNIVHDPSYLYHYLMSFPYRAIAYFTSSIEVQVIALRFINIGLVVAALVYMRKILRLIGVPSLLVNLILLAFALTPLVTALSAQINYDNLLILVSTFCVYQTVLFVQSLRREKVDVQRLLALLALCLFASEVKFSFPPIFVGIVAVLTWQLAVYWRDHRKDFTAQVTTGFKQISMPKRVILLIALLVGGGLFATSYGYNMVAYRTLEPQCNEVLSIQDCKQYYSWDRNYIALQYAQIHHVANTMNIMHFTWFWFKVQYYQLFAEIVPSGGMIYIARTYYMIVMFMTVVALVCLAASYKKIIRNHKALLVIAAIALTYLLALWSRNYHDYLYYKQPLAIQGRYIVPVLMYFYTICGLGIMYAFETRRKARMVLQPLAVTLVVFSFVYFGGYVRYVSNVSPNFGWLHQPRVSVVPPRHPQLSLL